jgi:enoyl-CoA hydratase/carnithine racemase
MLNVSRRGDVAVLQMANGKANAMSLEFCDSFAQHVEEFRASNATALVITGQGRIFSAGVDLLRLSAGGAAYAREFLPALNAMFMSVFACDKPTVAAINGHAIAGGCVLACATDKRLMVRDGGRIGATELLVGVPFPMLAMEILRRAIAAHRLEAAILAGATYTPEEAAALGFVDEVVSEDLLLDRAVAAAEVLAAVSPAAFALTKRQTRAPAFERVERGGAVDAEVIERWCADATLARVRDYVARTLKKS